MDALYHVVFSLAGGFILARGLGINAGPLELGTLALFSMLPDLDHLTGYTRLHTGFIILLPLIPYAILRIRDAYREKRGLLLILAVMLYGHLLMDMVQGLYGVALFYPLTETLYLIPGRWEVYLDGDPTKPIVGTHGIGAALYFGLIALILCLKRFSSRFLEKVSCEKEVPEDQHPA
ncbi:MAG: metal-dependent hydrolase [Candidatus Altiarchaeota archaeon]|nr:metal-dependent hydrolase [Candidatus Altiarchaeota archaeon]